MVLVTIADPADDAPRAASRARQEGVAVGVMDARTVRAALHLDVDDAKLARAIDVLRRALPLAVPSRAEAACGSAPRS
jgi:hypothetical protein